MAVDFATCLARLLTDEDLRVEFEREPARVADSLELQTEDRSSLAALSADELKRQAELLLKKRFHEVSQLIPRTIARLGCQAYRQFRDYATTSWPKGHRRHLLDAAAFCQHLRHHECDCVSESEANRALFTALGRRVSVRLARDLTVNGRSRRAVQILFCRRGQVREWILYLG